MRIDYINYQLFEYLPNKWKPMINEKQNIKFKLQNHIIINNSQIMENQSQNSGRAISTHNAVIKTK